MKKIYFLCVTLITFAGGILCSFYETEIRSATHIFFSKPTVSIIMPTYNRAEALPGAIDSILNQTFTDFEFIIVDDGSTDNTEKVVRKYAQKDNRIIYLKNDKNRGIVFGLNRGLDKAKGKYIARMDDDDKSTPRRLERQVLAMDMYPEIALLGAGISGTMNVQDTTTPPEIENPKKVEVNTYFSSGLAHPTIVIRRDFLTKNNIRYSEQYRYAEDCALYKDVLNAGGLISAIKEQLLQFRAYTSTKGGPQYGYVQYDSFKGLQREKLNRLGMIPDEKLLGSFHENLSRCLLLDGMKNANDKTHILDREALDTVIKETCPKMIEDAINVSHPYWKDWLTRIGENRIERFSTKDKATILEETPTSITIKWDKWDAEVYHKKNQNTFIYQNDGDGKIKKL